MVGRGVILVMVMDLISICHVNNVAKRTGCQDMRTACNTERCRTDQKPPGWVSRIQSNNEPSNKVAVASHSEGRWYLAKADVGC